MTTFISQKNVACDFFVLFCFFYVFCFFFMFFFLSPKQLTRLGAGEPGDAGEDMAVKVEEDTVGRARPAGQLRDAVDVRGPRRAAVGGRPDRVGNGEAARDIRGNGRTPLLELWQRIHHQQATVLNRSKNKKWEMGNEQKERVAMMMSRTQYEEKRRNRLRRMKHYFRQKHHCNAPGSRGFRGQRCSRASRGCGPGSRRTGREPSP